MKKLTIYGFLVFFIIGLLASYHRTTVSIASYAQAVIATCANKGFPPSCYDEEIPKLMDRISMEQAFEVTRLVQKSDPKYLYCHVLAHKISFRETSKDLTKWKDVVTRCPTTMCNNGCQHGALMRRFNAESLTDDQIEEIKPDLSDVCEPRGSWHPVEVERSMCYHALGHLHMYITRANVNKSIDLCRAVGTKSDGRNYLETCSGGVLMTIFQPLEPEDYALVKGLTPSKEQVAIFCSQFTGDTWDACRREAWPLFFDEIQTPSGLLSFCAYATDAAAQNRCISTGMNILTVSFVVQNNHRLDTLEAFCRQLPDEIESKCFGNAAFRLVQIDPLYGSLAMRLCDTASKYGHATACYESLLEHATHSFQPGSNALEQYCKTFPQDWQARCRQRTSP